MGFIVGHNRDRDSYQVPLALAEHGELDLFVTDFYHGRAPLTVPSLKHRKHPDLDSEKVRSSLGALLHQLPYEATRRLGGHAVFPSMRVEKSLGRTIAAHARKSPGSDLLLYSGSALQAFQGPSSGRRMLFQYHPSPGFIERTLSGIDDLAGLRPWEDEAEVNNPAMERHHQAEVALADHFIVASSFTKKGLIELGIPEGKISVVPYGCPEPTSSPAPPEVRHEFLFVGQGVRRKGLHLLAEAWRKAGLKNMSLRIVSSRIDPEIARYASGIPGITLSSRVSRAELTELMATADTFVMPSLVEGFGLVFGEALAQGCRLIGSDNTGVPDYHLDSRLATTVPAGSLEALTEALQSAAATMNAKRPYWHAAVAAAQERGWPAFRNGIARSAGLAVSEPTQLPVTPSEKRTHG